MGVGFGAMRAVPADTAARPLAGRSGDFAGMRGKGETRQVNGAAKLRHQLAGNELRPRRVCSGADRQPQGGSRSVWAWTRWRPMNVG
jgi:hypothetical protein